MYFYNRTDAGKRLAELLADYKEKPGAMVLALPRGGVPVAYEIARALHLPLDLLLVRKLGVPGHEELAMGAIANGNIQVMNDDVVRGMQIPDSVIHAVAEKERAELERRSRAYRRHEAPALSGRTVMLVDDGCATGSNMKAAVQAVMKQQAARIVVAVPVASFAAYAMLQEMAGDVVCLDIPEPFNGVGEFYHDFSQVPDHEVRALLAQAEESGFHPGRHPAAHKKIAS